MSNADRILRLTPSSFFHLKAGERQYIRTSSEDPDVRSHIADLIVQFLVELSVSSDPDLERAFIVGREMSLAWPEDSSPDLVSRVSDSVPAQVGRVFIAGFRPSSVEQKNPPRQAPSLYHLEGVIRTIRERGVSSASHAARSLITEHLSYTEITGFSRFLAQATVRTSSALIKRPQPERFEGGALAQLFVRDALKWEPWNARLWELWSDSYIAQGGFTPAELILWEGTRRFPENPAFSDRLIRLVSRQRSRATEALEVAYAALRRFPENAYLENATAIALLRAKRPDEALVLTLQSLRRSPGSDVAITVLASAILAAANETAEPFHIKLDRLALLPPDPLLFGKIGRALSQQRLQTAWLISYYRYSIARIPGDNFLRNQLAAALLRSASSRTANSRIEEEAKVLFESVLHDDPENGFAQEGLRRIESGESREFKLAAGVEFLDPTGNSIESEEALEEEKLQPGNPGNLTERPWPEIPSVVERFGRARRLSSRLETTNDDLRDEALQELRTFIQDEPTFAYAQLLAVRQGIWEASSKVPSTFAAAFELAIQKGTDSDLAALENRAPRLSALLTAARAVFGNSEAIAEVRRLQGMEEVRTELETRVVRLIGPVISLKASQATTRGTFADPVARLRELNEWALSEALDLAA